MSWLSMIFSENRRPLFRIMLYAACPVFSSEQPVIFRLPSLCRSSV
jgi:hypothetical protein